MKITLVRALSLAALSSAAFALPAMAEDSEAEIAKKSLNPVAAMISLPMKLDYDRKIGPLEQGDKYQLTVQPVIPFSLGTDHLSSNKWGLGPTGVLLKQEHGWTYARW